MARIVSGVGSYEDPGLAFLAGRERGASSRREQDAESRKNMAAMLAFAKAQTDYHREETKALQRHQQGARDAHALAAWGALTERAQMHPKAAERLRRAQSAHGALSKMAERGVSEDTIQRVLGHIHEAEKGIEHHEGVQAAQSAIQAAVQDGVTDEQGAQLYAQRSQQDPQGVLKELQEARVKRSTDAANSENSMEAFARAKAITDASPPGRQRDLARTHLKEFEMSPSTQARPDSGANLLQLVSQTLIGSQEQYDEAQTAAQERRAAQFTTAPMPGLGGMSGNEMRDQLGRTPTLGMGGPNIGGDVTTIPGTHATVKSKKRGTGKMIDPRRATLEVIQSAKDDRDLLRLLKERGVRLTSTNIAAVKKASEEWRQRAAPGADR